LNSTYHAKSAARKWGGHWEQYAPIEELIDSSKQYLGDIRHRALYHHTAGIFLCQKIFGPVITISKENHTLHPIQVPTRLIAERHIIEDLGWIPSPNDYWDGLPISPWMSGAKLREEPLNALGLRVPGPDVSDWTSSEDAVYDQR
jgi:hypothetical protein